MNTEKELFIQQIANLAQKALIKGYKAEASVLFSLCDAAFLGLQDDLCLHVTKFTE